MEQVIGFPSALRKDCCTALEVLDWYEVIRRWRLCEQGRRMLMIAMAANAMESHRECCLAWGMDSFVSKLSRAEDLRQVPAALLGG